MNRLTVPVFRSLIDALGVWKVFPKRPIRSVSVDSRLVKPNDLFFALPGAKTDGRHFIFEAIQKGASAVVVQQMPSKPLSDDVGILLVDNGVDVLQKLASQAVEFVSPKILALTGSLGKTTTKEYTQALLASCGPVMATAENFNSQIGLALSSLQTLLASERNPHWFVSEMGMTEKGNLSKLVSLFPPHVALVTGVYPVHIQNFSSLEDIAHAKAEIFESPRCEVSLVNLDTPGAHILLQKARGRVVTMSMKQNASYTLRILTSSIIFQYEGKEVEFKKPEVHAPHQFENLLHSLAMAVEAGGQVECFHKPLENLPASSRRLEKIEKKGVLFINDSYNACEQSMKAALDVLDKSKGMRKIAVLGQMRELGSFSHECHAQVGKFAKDRCDMLFCLGEECGPLVDAYQTSGKHVAWVQTLNDLHELLAREVLMGDVVLLKGSKSNKLWEVVDHFSGGDKYVSAH